VAVIIYVLLEVEVTCETEIKHATLFFSSVRCTFLLLLLLLLTYNHRCTPFPFVITFFVCGELRGANNS
jgi:hypothetical protein